VLVIAHSVDEVLIRQCVIKTTIYVCTSSRDDLVVAWNEVADGFGDHGPPSTLIGVSVLGFPDQLVEVEAIALASPS
jgi:enamine deaminase RidA (YjgF/YER057c/UK114 family)